MPTTLSPRLWDYTRQGHPHANLTNLHQYCGDVLEAFKSFKLDHLQGSSGGAGARLSRSLSEPAPDQEAAAGGDSIASEHQVRIRKGFGEGLKGQTFVIALSYEKGCVLWGIVVCCLFFSSILFIYFSSVCLHVHFSALLCLFFSWSYFLIFLFCYSIILSFII